MQQLDQDKILSSKEASNLLGITTGALRRMREKGKGPQAHCYAKAWVYKVSDLISWSASNWWVLDIAQPVVKQEVAKVRQQLHHHWKSNPTM